MCEGQRRGRGFGHSLLENLAASDLPVAQRTARASLNLLRRVWRRQRCCGHYGEPGC